jgi:hypothetical protein
MTVNGRIRGVLTISERRITAISLTTCSFGQVRQSVSNGSARFRVP